MIITDELAQKIVNIAHALIHRNVNIMNKDGVIIGTAQKHRYRTVHKGAQEVVETGEPLEIYPHEVNQYPGALPGVNLPIILEEQIIGVVGVSGDPQEVQASARLIKKITELILERELFQEEMRSRRRLKEQFVDLLINRSLAETMPRIKRLAKTLGFDLGMPRAVVVADISPLIQRSYTEYGQSELVLDRSEKNIIQHLGRHHLTTSKDIAVILDKKLIILKEFQTPLCHQLLQQWCQQLCSAFDNRKKGPVFCGIGAVVKSMYEYQMSFAQAEFCLKYCADSRPFTTVYDRDVSAKYLLHSVTNSPASMIIRPLVESFDTAFRQKKEYSETLRVLLDNNLEIEMTAHALGIHRNTLTYRLAKIKEATGLDPVRCFHDAIIGSILTDQLDR